MPIAEVTTKLRGRSIYPVVVLALATGMRRGELLGLRWADVDLDGAKLRVERSLEETTAGGLRFKAPKTKRGRRLITLPPRTVELLRAHRKQQLELRLALGLGKMGAEALVFPTPDSTSPRSPRGLTKDWSRTVTALGLPRVTFHALRHTHVSALIADGMDILTISRRLGHSNPNVTLAVYGHKFDATDDRAASAIDAVLGELQ